MMGLKLISRTRGDRNVQDLSAKTRRLSTGIAATAILMFTGLLFATNLTTVATAQDDLPTGFSRAIGDGPPKERFYTPFFDKTSGSYFQLVSPNRTYGWLLARDDAERRAYSGRKGRLAVIRSNKTYNNIMQNLNTDAIDDTWIGLEYLCGPQALAWVDGTLYKQGEFAAWGPQWTRSDFGEDCTDSYMGVTLSPHDGFRWLAWGQGKGFDWYLVEYPAPDGKKTSDAAAPASNQ
jgi:Lectin C-type domain